MNGAALFETTVPVFLHYLRRIEGLLHLLPEEAKVLLEKKLTPHAFSAAEHLETAIGFSARTVSPLLGRELTDLEEDDFSHQKLLQLVSDSVEFLEGLNPIDFEGTNLKRIRHTAGTANLEQDAATFVTIFSMPNFFFHLSTAFAILRHEGVDIGKADFDGQHSYAAGFHF